MTLTRIDDKVLLRMIVAGDGTALDEFYRRYHRLVFSIAYHVLQQPQTAEEVVLTVFTYVWQRAGQYDAQRGQVNTWLTQIARNRAIDVVRREKRRPEGHSISWEEMLGEPHSWARNPEGAAQNELRRTRVRAALEQLPEEQRRALALAYFGGYTQREIADLLGEPLGTVKSRIRIGMDKLRFLLRDERA